MGMNQNSQQPAIPQSALLQMANTPYSGTARGGATAQAIPQILAALMAAKQGQQRPQPAWQPPRAVAPGGSMSQIPLAPASSMPAQSQA